MNILIYGAGAIGCHIGYCMYVSGHAVTLVCRGEHYKQMKKTGMHIKICDNEVVQHEQTIKEDARFKILNDVNQIKDPQMDRVFITVKMGDYNEQTLKSLHPFMGQDTAVVPPCTKLPFWWFYNLNGNSDPKYNNIDYDPQVSRYFIRENIICMTMWLSAVIDRPGSVCVRHVQRGYPLGAVFPKMNDHAEKIRNIFEKTCMSPVVENIRSEIFIKSINSFAFNTVAIDREFNNLQLSRDESSKDSVRKIMEEGDQILRTLNIPIIQSVEDRITQTLSSSKHTMSMLHDYRTGHPIELSYHWDGFKKISDILGVKMEYSRYMYEKVISKIDARDSATALSA